MATIQILGIYPVWPSGRQRLASIFFYFIFYFFIFLVSEALRLSMWFCMAFCIRRLRSRICTLPNAERAK